MTRSTIALLLAAATALPAAPAALAAAPPVLAANVEITGGTAGSTMVKLAKPITAAALGQTTGTAVTGGASVATVVLVKNGSPTSPGFVWQYVKYGNREEWNAFTLGNPSSKNLLAPGVYKLYYNADKAGTMKLKIGNQPGGTKKIKVTGKAKGRTAAVSVPALVSNQPPLTNESHDTYTASKAFMVFGIVGFELTTKHQLKVQSCTYQGDAPASAKNCDSGGTLGPADDSTGSAVPTIAATYVRRTRLQREAAGKKLTYGIYYETTGIPKNVYRWNVWIELG